MDTWLKMLFAVTCAVVIAGVGLYFYRDQQMSVASAETQLDSCYKALSMVILGTTPDSEDPNRARQLKKCEQSGLLRPDILEHIYSSRIGEYYRTL